MNEMNATHNRMESLVYNLADDLRELRSAANMQFMQFQTTTAELKQKTDKISHDNKKVADKIRAHQVKGGGRGRGVQLCVDGLTPLTSIDLDHCINLCLCYLYCRP